MKEPCGSGKSHKTIQLTLFPAAAGRLDGKDPASWLHHSLAAPTFVDPPNEKVIPTCPPVSRIIFILTQHLLQFIIPVVYSFAFLFFINYKQTIPLFSCPHKWSSLQLFCIRSFWYCDQHSSCRCVNSMLEKWSFSSHLFTEYISALSNVFWKSLYGGLFFLLLLNYSRTINDI